jgi:hypothetical protein
MRSMGLKLGAEVGFEPTTFRLWPPNDSWDKNNENVGLNKVDGASMSNQMVTH